MASITNRPITGKPRQLPEVSTSVDRINLATQVAAASAAIPLPRRQVLVIMRSISKAIGGNAIPLCQGAEEGTIGFRHPADGLTILGTGCRRPLLCEEAQDLRSFLGDHVLLVRTEDAALGLGPFTVDILLSHMESWLIRYRLWQIHPTSDLWLVPTQGEGRSVRLLAGYLAVSPRAPFFNLYEREQGFAIAAGAIAGLEGGE